MAANLDLQILTSDDLRTPVLRTFGERMANRRSRTQPTRCGHRPDRDASLATASQELLCLILYCCGELFYRFIQLIQETAAG